MESAKHWELPGEELGTGTRRSENHLNGGIDCISSFVPHSNWGSKSTKFDDLLRERRSKSMADCKSVEVFLRRFESCLSHLFVVDFREEKRGIRQRRKAWSIIE
ncbi:hypothetical protein Tco_1380354 [Tanacetum coccineum]